MIKKPDYIVAKEYGVKAGYLVNNKEVETKTERFIYNSRKILTKVYHDNNLCMIHIAVN